MNNSSPHTGRNACGSNELARRTMRGENVSVKRGESQMSDSLFWLIMSFTRMRTRYHHR